MKTRRAPHVIAGWLYALAALPVGGIWYILLSTTIPDQLTVWQNAERLLGYLFSSANPDRWFFVGLVALPVLCIAMSVAYLSTANQGKNWRIVLFAVGVVLAAAAFALTTWSMAAFVAWPLLWGYRAIHDTSPSALEVHGAQVD